MLVATLELWPQGDRTRAKQLVNALIWNDGSGTPETGNYQYLVSTEKDPEGGFWTPATVDELVDAVLDNIRRSTAPTDPSITKGSVSNWDRSQTAAELLTLVLEKENA